jgi:hypothetical protein
MYPYSPDAWSDDRAAVPPHQWHHGHPSPAPTPAPWGVPPAASYRAPRTHQPIPVPHPGGSPWPPASCPGMPATTPAPQRRSGRWAGAIAGVVVLAAVASAIVLWPLSTGDSGSQSASAPPPPAPTVPVPVSAMDGLLLTRAEASTILGTGPLAGREGRSDEVYTQMVPQTAVVDDDCNLGIPALSKNHEGSGWEAVRRQYLATQDSADASANRALIQAVVNFPDASTAQQFVESSKAAWQRCANRSIDLKRLTDTSAPSQYWKTGELSDSDGGIRMSWTREGGDGWYCHDSMTPRNNVVIELELCGRSSSAPLDDVNAHISENIEAAQ